MPSNFELTSKRKNVAVQLTPEQKKQRAIDLLNNLIDKVKDIPDDACIDFVLNTHYTDDYSFDFTGGKPGKKIDIEFKLNYSFKIKE